MSDPVIVSTIRTVRIRTHPATNPGKLQAIDRTQAEWHRAVDFYTAFFLDHQDVLAETKIGLNRKKEPVAKPWTAQDLLTWAERWTVRTESHPDILRDFAVACPVGVKPLGTDQHKKFTLPGYGGSSGGLIATRSGRTGGWGGPAAYRSGWRA